VLGAGLKDRGGDWREGEREPNKIPSQELDQCPTFKTPSKNPRRKVMKKLTNRITMIPTKL
jgi:hypothetical protein